MTTARAHSSQGFARVTAIEPLIAAGRGDVFTSDLAAQAAGALLARVGVAAGAIDFLVLCTETPDFALPTTACIVQSRLGLSRDAGAVDITHGAAGFVYGLGLAKALVESGQATRVLLITADARSKAVERFTTAGGALDDVATATLVEIGSGDVEHIAAISLGADGDRTDAETTIEDRASALVGAVIARADASGDAVDLLLLQLPSPADPIDMDLSARRILEPSDPLGTGSSAIPIALADALARGNVSPGSRVAIAGMDDGRSWGGALLTW